MRKYFAALLALTAFMAPHTVQAVNLMQLASEKPEVVPVSRPKLTQEPAEAALLARANLTPEQPETAPVVQPKLTPEQPETAPVVQPKLTPEQPETAPVVQPKLTSEQPETAPVVQPKLRSEQPETAPVPQPKLRSEQPETAPLAPQSQIAPVTAPMTMQYGAQYPQSYPAVQTAPAPQYYPSTQQPSYPAAQPEQSHPTYVQPQYRWPYQPQYPRQYNRFYNQPYPAYGNHFANPLDGEEEPGYHPFDGQITNARPGYFPQNTPEGPMYRPPGAVAEAGLMIPVSLRTAISTQVAKQGDYIVSVVARNVPLSGTAYIPAGSEVTGEITESIAGRRLSRSGALSIQFNSIRLPGGQSLAMNAHLVGTIGKYKEKNGVARGEGAEAKFGQFFLRAGAGAGLGAALGTGLGAIAGGGEGVGRGAWGGAAIGGGLGGLDMLLRKGRDVIIPSGTEMQLQLEEPLSLPEPGMPS